MSPQKSNCFVATISTELEAKLRQDLEGQGFSFAKPAYTLFSAQKPGVSCTLYASGKLMVQGKAMEEFITFYLEPEILKSVAFSYPETEVNLQSHIGIDESGKGDFFGPLCIAGVQANEAQIKTLLSLGVRDSKALTDKVVLPLSVKIRQSCPHSLIVLFPQKYNELYASFKNLNKLLAWGHATAIAELVQKTGCKEVIIDQFASEEVVEKALAAKQLTVHLTQRHRAEADPVVAAASILARAAFLSGLENLSAKYQISLPKGASQQIVRIGKQLVGLHGKEILSQVGKLHFKTTSEILG